MLRSFIKFSQLIPYRNVYANPCRRHCLHFSSLAYNLTHTSRGRIYELNAKVERAD